MSVIKFNGDVNIPEPLRELFNLIPGSNVTFIAQEGQLVLAKDDRGLMALETLCEEIRKEAQEKGITEQDLLDELEQVREEMWNERKHKYIPDSN